MGQGTFDQTVVVVDVIATGGSADWAILSARAANGEVVRLVGNDLKSCAVPEHHLRVVGRRSDDARFGPQVAVLKAETIRLFPDPEADPQTELERVPHVGSQRAETLIREYGTRGIWGEIDRNARAFFLQIGLTPLQAHAATQWWREHRPDSS
ncbi:MAG: phosphoribosyltransferase [Solirubrobacteraceae bacterium]|nr:phosphoribosyltransferase [Solirubrobacteraceae bacterium]